MKKLLLPLTILSFSLYGQKTNEPTIVYPLLEQFISEAYNRDIPVYHKIREIDSIQMTFLKYPITGEYHSRGVIKIHKGYQGRRIEKTFFHESGHVFDLEHSDNPHEIMYNGPYSDWFENNENWQKAKDEYFKKLKP